MAPLSSSSKRGSPRSSLERTPQGSHTQSIQRFCTARRCMTTATGKLGLFIQPASVSHSAGAACALHWSGAIHPGEQQMRLQILVLAATLALAAGCNKSPDDAKKPASRADKAPPAPVQSNTPTTPANIGQPGSQEEKKDGANPVQGQVDPKAREQQRDFQQKGDGA